MRMRATGGCRAARARDAAHEPVLVLRVRATGARRAAHARGVALVLVDQLLRAGARGAAHEPVLAMRVRTTGGRRAARAGAAAQVPAGQLQRARTGRGRPRNGVGAVEPAACGGCPLVWWRPVWGCWPTD